MKFDLHVHSKYSADSRSDPKDIAKILEDRGFSGVAILDHNTLDGYKKLKELDTSLIAVPGIEVSTEEGHVMGLGLQEEIGRQREVDQAIEKIREHGGLAIAAHPHRFWSGIGERNVLEHDWDGLEGMNGRSWGIRNRQSQRLAEKMELPITGGSDSHRLKTVGKAYTTLENVGTWEDVIHEIKKGNTQVGGQSRTWIQTFFYVRRALLGWFKRGFKKI